MDQHKISDFLREHRKMCTANSCDTTWVVRVRLKKSLQLVNNFKVQVGKCFNRLDRPESDIRYQLDRSG